ncbi:hypothetical protein BGZ65_006417 [Modicella reniformis]|uniref:AN1-type domain-containing protein n=1 Tax=Modicella reniformis TaxID=1440133 RepID=A0A9P6INQ3_9FUNG|nr:hypothetical protein BGZ65_006417 [Modicella reniformis]
MILVPKQQDPAAVTCPDCSKTFCLQHRHGLDHECSKIEERKQEADTENQRKKDLKAEIANRFGVKENNQHGVENAKEKVNRTKERAEAAKAAIAEAKSKIAARKASALSGSTSGTAATTVAAAPPPKVNKVSRVVLVMKLKKVAQGEDKIPLSSRIYVSIRSPVHPQLDDKAIYVDKRFSIFHAKEVEDIPIIINMSDRLQQVSSLENGDIFYLASADWEGPAE